MALIIQRPFVCILRDSIPQESTGFAPFELLYGRTVRRPMGILHRSWTEEESEEEVRCSYQCELRERIENTFRVARRVDEIPSKTQAVL